MPLEVFFGGIDPWGLGQTFRVQRTSAGSWLDGSARLNMGDDTWKDL